MIARIEAAGAASRALHAACGFELVGIERQVGRKFNRWLDVAVMQIAAVTDGSSGIVSHVDRSAAERCVGREGFEPPKALPADLQSAPFGRSGTDP